MIIPTRSPFSRALLGALAFFEIVTATPASAAEPAATVVAPAAAPPCVVRRRWRAEAAGGLGFDNLGGIGSEGIAFIDAGGRIEWRAWGPILLGAAASGRWDLTAYDYALETSASEHKPAFEARAIVGLTWSRFEATFGARVYGEGRQGQDFRVGFSLPPLPFGSFHLRFGSVAHDNIEVSYGDGVPFTATGGNAFRLTRGLSGWERFFAVGGYYNPFEESAGIVFVVDGQPRNGRTHRLGVLLGTDSKYVFSRPEAAVTYGWAWY
jgi:hypothetical protein